MRRMRILLRGIVQGVGFRPYVYRLAQSFGLSGTVQNTPEGVVIEAQGEEVLRFLEELPGHLPPLARIDEMAAEDVPARAAAGFAIIESSAGGRGDSLISPDVALCASCSAEMAAPKDRRYRYPFINCTDCGPRFSIVQGMPYDRPNTTMKVFAMCPECEKEYSEPADRRYHAQPISCFACGPSLAFVDGRGGRHADPLDKAAERLAEGKVVAVKGLGGFHLACLASSESAVQRLRNMKNRETKPFALMGTQEMVERECLCTPEELEWLNSRAAPIVLMRKGERPSVAEGVARGHNRLGFMLPYTPLHRLLLERVGQPLVMTSANIADEPIAYRDDPEPLRRLADFILCHDRPIEVFADDSVLQMHSGQPQIIRRSRGFVPYHLEMARAAARTVLGVGALLKGTFTFLKGKRALLSQYIATLDSPRSLEAEKKLIAHFQRLFALEPEVVACDLHPEYPSRTLLDEFSGSRRVEVQHHRAHLAALLAENREEGSIIGVAMDGTGYGEDGAIWGGEFFTGGLAGLQRSGHLQYFFLPGGDAAVKEPWRIALSILHSLHGAAAETEAFAERFGAHGRKQLEAIAKRIGGVNTSSCGRIFDAAASLLHVGQRNTYDGELPSLLQALAERSRNEIRAYSYSIRRQHDGFVLDLLPVFAEMLADGAAIEDRAAAFHRALAGGIVRLVESLRYDTGIGKVGLSGGVFQNLFLLDATVRALREKGFAVLLHRHVPCNDGGVSLGQAVLASRAGSLE